MTATKAPTPGPLSGDDDLLPCPFCEGDVIVTDSQECQDAETYYWHRCAGCGVESEGAHGASAARDQWNMRPQPFRLAPTAPVEASGSEREITIKVGDDRIGPWRIWFDPPPIGARNCDWHYQHEDDDGSRGWMSGSCATREDCLEEIITQYEERGS